MALGGEEIFYRGKAGYDSDFLDDTALITAFDNAINPIKAMLGDKHLQNAATGKPSHKPSKKKHRKNRNKSKKEDALTRWHVGCPCRCKFSEDGLVYNAVITSIDDENLCTVRYDHYNNEEQQRLCDLLPPDSQSHSSIESSDVESVKNVSAFLTDNEPKEGFKLPHFAKQRTHKSNKSSTKTAPNRLPHFSSSAFPFSSDLPPYPHMPTAYPQVPPPFTHMPRSFCRIPPSFPRVPGVPLIPPPPPPVMSDIESTDCDKEALYSMLISWYMSGYHTGYYEGLKKHRHNRRQYDDDSAAETTSTETASSAK